ncbi:ABC-F family ATP-binding cassette domain-containing protein [Paludibaculum fermentans]|uniref:Probable ATP-binding protein YbiT n=1 Tax=Paludibaculum fermentans TaxID=1473598 RepID=A0A7S7NNQ9_PALFE|nr:ABC-F family ATP-binding cassette domain-containing protein [Paludibaculum fermentans]QOY87003.1 ABC-F family ATP-binding cassette domain-containing protein [Paludibaculum fermentans]
MISLVNASKRFGPKLLFEGVNWLITPQDRVGLVGANGTGKSTVMKILAGFETIDSGDVTTQKGITAGYLPQDGLSLSGRTVFEECLSVFDHIRDMEREMEQLAHAMSELDPTSEEYAITTDRFGHLDSQFRNRDGYALEAKVGSVLSGLGFPKEEWTKRTEYFSGGWQMRIALAKLLLEQPDLLLLDEPTNHLDLEARNWLEEYLGNYPNAFVLISHDRYFLDVAVSKIVELWNKNLHFYTGGYERYLSQKTERLTLLEAAYRNQQERIEQLEAFINRFRYQATKAKQVQSRIKELEKIERIEIPPEEKAIHFSFPQPKASGRVVAEFTNVSKAYGDRVILDKVNFAIERGERVALVGVNGAGKSTLIKLLAGTESLTRGDYKIGHNVQPDYFAQDQYKELDTDSRLLDDLMSVANGKTVTELRSLLGCFLFSEDDVFKQIGVLSGGERNRYALARMLLNPSNFLLLDEPTNHLDLRAKDVLLESLQAFTGTVVFVSHDRYFIDKLATKVYEIANGEVEVFPGNYEDYQYRKAGGSPVVSAPVAAAVVEDPSAPKPEARKQRLNPLKVKQLEDKAAKLEAKSMELEAEIGQLEQALQDFVNAEETRRQMELLDQRRKQLDAVLAEWEAISLEIEEVR